MHGLNKSSKYFLRTVSPWVTKEKHHISHTENGISEATIKKHKSSLGNLQLGKRLFHFY